MNIRHATLADLKGILDISNKEIVNGTAFWMTIPRTYEEQVQWFEAREKAGYPVFVAVDEMQKVLGFASYGAFRAYDGYKHTVEHSVYISFESQGKGLGKKLLDRLISHATKHNVHVMVACITEGNVASVRLHEWFGFKHGGVLPETGIKFDRWLSLLFMYKVLTDNT